MLKNKSGLYLKENPGTLKFWKQIKTVKLAGNPLKEYMWNMNIKAKAVKLCLTES